MTGGLPWPGRPVVDVVGVDGVDVDVSGAVLGRCAAVTAELEELQPATTIATRAALMYAGRREFTKAWGGKQVGC